MHILRNEEINFSILRTWRIRILKEIFVEIQDNYSGMIRLTLGSLDARVVTAEVALALKRPQLLGDAVFRAYFLRARWTGLSRLQVQSET